jgi:hypothetical protein
MTYYVLRKISPPGKSARADQATAVALVEAVISHGGPVYGDYLEWSDPDDKNGWGFDGWTPDLNRAQRFATFEDAMQCWKAQSTVVPFRPDGKPNRPMTAYSVTPEKIEEP